MGTRRGNQEVLSEQRQNRGNLHHAPNYNRSRQHPPGLHRGHFDICGSLVLMGLMGGLSAEQLFQTRQSRVVLLLFLKREGKREARVR